MSQKTKLVLYASIESLNAHAAGYPCLVNYNPFEKTGVFDDGCGHTASVVFAVATTGKPMNDLLARGFDIVEFTEFAAISKGQYVEPNMAPEPVPEPVIVPVPVPEPVPVVVTEPVIAPVDPIVPEAPAATDPAAPVAVDPTTPQRKE